MSFVDKIGLEWLLLYIIMLWPDLRSITPERY